MPTAKVGAKSSENSPARSRQSSKRSSTPGKRTMESELSWAADSATLTALAKDKDWETRARVASIPGTPAPVLKRLAEDRRLAVRVAVAQNPKTPRPTLTKLADSRSVDIRLALARNKSTPPAALHALIHGTDTWDYRIVFLVARNPQTQDRTLRLLQNHKGISLGEWIAARSNISLAMAKALAADSDRRVRLALAKNPQCPVAVLEKLSHDVSALVRRASATHPASLKHRRIGPAARASSPAKTSGLTAFTANQQHLLEVIAADDISQLERFKRAGGATVITAAHVRAYEIGQLSLTELKVLAKDSAWLANASRFLAFARDHGMKPARYAGLCIDLQLDRALCASIASGFQLPVSSRKLLSSTKGMSDTKGMLLGSISKTQDPASVVRAAVSMRADDFLAQYIFDKGLASPGILKLAAKEKLSRTCWAIVQKMDLSPGDLENLVEVPSWSEVLAWDVGAEYGWSTKLRNSIDFSERDSRSTYHVQHVAATHPATPQRALERLSTARSGFVRAGIATRTDLSMATVRKLAADREPRVRAAIAENDVCPHDILLSLAGDNVETVRAAAAQHAHATDDVRAIASLMGWTQPVVREPAAKKTVKPKYAARPSP